MVKYKYVGIIENVFKSKKKVKIQKLFEHQYC
jgi:hypothetical protein